MFVALLVVLGAWGGGQLYRQKVAIREIKRAGGHIYFEPVGPQWLREFVGEERMAIIDEVDYVHFRPDEATFRRRFSGIYCGRTPYTTGPTIDDRSLACLSGISTLRRLDLRWTNVTDAGMIRLSSLRELRELLLDGTDVSDASCKVFAELINLEELSIPRTHLSGAGLECLQTLSKLNRLHLDGTLLTPIGVKCLSALPRLEDIFVGFDCETDVLEATRQALPHVHVQ
jgi:hypothetical protein